MDDCWGMTRGRAWGLSSLTAKHCFFSFIRTSRVDFGHFLRTSEVGREWLVKFKVWGHVDI